MDIQFCDRCDSSIPTGDLDEGRAARKDGRLICRKCRGRGRIELVVRITLVSASLLLVAVLGAAGAVLVLGPRIDSLESELASVRTELRSAAAGDPGRDDEMKAMREVDRGQTERIDALTRSLNETFVGLSAAMEDWSGKSEKIGEEIVSIKEHLKKASEDVPPVEVTDLELLLPLVTDPDPGARITALIKLAAFPDPRVDEYALTALADPDPRVRFEAALLLGRRKNRSAVPKLLDLLSDESDLARHAAHRALCGISGEAIAYEPTQPADVRAAGVAAWKAWWKKQEAQKPD
jgi:hypothetical protein